VHGPALFLSDRFAWFCSQISLVKKKPAIVVAGFSACLIDDSACTRNSPDKKKRDKRGQSQQADVQAARGYAPGRAGDGFYGLFTARTHRPDRNIAKF
jgi:hypothetical protein